MAGFRTELLGLPDGRWDLLIPNTYLTVKEILSLRKAPPPPNGLRSATHLAAIIGAKRARTILSTAKIKCEIDEHGNRACVWNGCNKFSTNGTPLCDAHWGDGAMLGNAFRNPKLKDLYHKLAASPVRGQLDNEQAVMRVMLAQLLERIDEHDSPPMDLIAQITILCEKIANTTERMSKLNVITPEQIERVLDSVCTIMMKYVPQESIAPAISEVKNLTVTNAKTCDIPYVPGDSITIEHGNTNIVPRRRHGDINAHDRRSKYCIRRYYHTEPGGVGRRVIECCSII
jgi:hypothetical protein